MRSIWILGLAACCAASTAWASLCVVCKASTSAQLYLLKLQPWSSPQQVCRLCLHLSHRCFACNYPTDPTRGQVVADGRIFCRREACSPIFAQRDAERLFEEIKREAQRLLAEWYPLPDANITVKLVDRNDFMREFRKVPSIEDPDKLLGLTRSSQLSSTRFDHTIYLLNGQSPASLMAVSAHEYTHAWWNEHRPEFRKVDKETTEGFCELVAYKVMTARQEEEARHRILTSDYTRGQIHALLAAEEKFRFHQIIDWMRRGEDGWLDRSHPERLLALKPTPPPALPRVWPAAPLPPAPEKLVLKGLSSSSTRRFALINDSTLQPKESAKIRVGTSNVTVRCLEIRSHSVLIRVEGQSGDQELFLKENSSCR